MASKKNQLKFRKNYLKLDPDFKDTISFKLDCGQRYAHTATTNYRFTMASLQPDQKKLPHCACNMINKTKNVSHDDDKVVVIVEHYLKEHILCILDSKKLHQCKLDLMIQAGEQMAFRTIGKTPVQLSGISLNDETSDIESSEGDTY